MRDFGALRFATLVARLTQMILAEGHIQEALVHAGQGALGHAEQQVLPGKDYTTYFAESG